MRALRFVLGASPLLIWATAAMADRTVFVNANLAAGASDGTSWANAYRGRLAVQAALSASLPGDEIWVAQGTYAPAAASGSRAVSFELRTNVALFGGFLGNETSRDQRNPATRITRLTGDLNSNGNSGTSGNDNTFHVVVAAGVDSSAILDGFTITGGVTDNSGTLDSRCGAGVQFSAGSRAVVRNCVFSANTARWRGGDAAILDSSPLMESCTFSGTSTASWGLAMAHLRDSSATIRTCRFVGNPPTTGSNVALGIYSDSTSAQGITVEGSYFSIVATQFACTPGVGMYVALNSRMTVRDSQFINNFTCGGGGGIHCDGTGAIDRCVFIGNEGEADGGAALFNFDGVTTVTNSLFAGNDRMGFSTIAIHGVMHFFNCTFASNGNTNANHMVVNTSQPGSTFSNCIFWNNRSTGPNPVLFTSSGVARPRFDSCLIQNWSSFFPGANSFAANPMFVNMLGADGVAGTIDDNLRLLSGSPAVDRGNNSLVPAGIAVDLDGVNRFRNDPNTADLGIGTPPLVDLGPYEFQPICAANFNDDQTLNSQDFFDFLGAFLAGLPSADFNSSGMTDSQDFFDFLAAFFAGC